MIRIGILGDIGSGKSYVAKSFGYPVFNADKVVGDLYKKDKKTFLKLKKILPKYFRSHPIKKEIVVKAVLANSSNLRKIVKVVHVEVRNRMNLFLKKNNKKKIVVLDIPLLLENKISKKKDFLVFVQSKKGDIAKKLKKRINFNKGLVDKLRKLQLPLAHKKRMSNFIIKNDFTEKTVKKQVKVILKKIL